MSTSDRNKANEQIILEICHDVFDAIRSKDVGSLANFLADDFTHRNHDGLESGKETFLSGIRTMPVEIVTVSGEHLRVSVYGDTAILTGVQHAEWRQGDGTGGVSSVAFTDVFVLRGGVWQMALAYSVELRS